MVKQWGVTLTYVAEDTGLSLSYISLVLRGKRIPRVHNFKLIADALGETMDSLYNKLAGSWRKDAP